jgi:hypothetical protein
VRPGRWAACHFTDNDAAAAASVPSLEHRREVTLESIVEQGAQA